MNPGVPPLPEPDLPRLTLESLEEQLRALPAAEVPEKLASKLAAAIPPAKAAGSLAVDAFRRWLLIGGGVLLCVAISAAVYHWQQRGDSQPIKEPEGGAQPIGASATERATPASLRAIEQYEKALQFDPYNADAWFNLAKAQAAANRSADAISSARKAIDIARSRNRQDLADAAEKWLRPYQASQANKAP